MQPRYSHRARNAPVQGTIDKVTIEVSPAKPAAGAPKAIEKAGNKTRTGED